MYYNKKNHSTVAHTAALQSVENRFPVWADDLEECLTLVRSATQPRKSLGKSTAWLSDASLRHPARKYTAKLRGDDTQRRHLQARFKRMARLDKDIVLNEVASEAEEARLVLFSGI